MNVDYDTVENGLLVTRTLRNVAKVTVKLVHQSMEFNDWTEVERATRR